MAGIDLSRKAKGTCATTTAQARVLRRTSPAQLLVI